MCFLAPCRPRSGLTRVRRSGAAELEAFRFSVRCQTFRRLRRVGHGRAGAGQYGSGWPVVRARPPPRESADCHRAVGFRV
eukprot:7941092-Pyramimonas_sp.AAC.1